MFEILPMDWNLKQIFTQKWASVDMNWGVEPPDTPAIPTLRLGLHKCNKLHDRDDYSKRFVASWPAAEPSAYCTLMPATDRQTDRQSGKATQNFIEIGWQFTEIWQHNGYQDGKGLQRCILKVWKIFIFDRRPLLLRIFASLYKMSRKWKNPPYRIMA